MSNLKIKLDTTALANTLKEYAAEVAQDVNKGVARLAAQTKAHVLMDAGAELSSPTFKTFSKSVEMEDISPGIWVVSINQKGLWIEEGIEPNTDMKPGLLKGKKFVVIPFSKDKSKASSTGYEFQLREQVKSALKKEGIPFKKIESNPNGSPKTGLLHRKDFGGEIPGKGNTPVLQGVSIYQTLTKTGNVRRDILTFRTVSSGPASAGKWMHPGYQPKKFLDKAQAWAEKEWEQTFLPEILAKWSK
jgi:hypothetical protein